jgi:hypothetical protein
MGDIEPTGNDVGSDGCECDNYSTALGIVQLSQKGFFHLIHRENNEYQFTLKPRTCHGFSRVRHPAGHGPALSGENSWFQTELILERR